MKTKRLIAMLLASVMVIGMLAGCAQQPAAAKADEKITLRMIDTLAAETRTAAIQKIINDYQAQNPNVTIELISPPTDGADQKVQQMLMAGEQLDIIDTGNSFQVCINNDWIQPLNDWIKDWNELGTITSAAKTRMTNFSTDGQTMWCIPYGLYQRLLFYRKDLLANAGVEAPEVWTWENVEEICKKVTDPAKGIYGFSFRGGARGFNCYDEMMMSYMDDSEICADESYRIFAPDGSVLYRNPKAKQALEDYKRFYTDYSPKDAISWGFTEMVQGYMSGTCAILIQDNDVIQSVESLDPSLWGVGNIPIGPSGYGTQSCGYGGWAMTKSTKYPEEAAKFLMFLSNAENNGYFCQQCGLIPIHTTTLEKNSYFSEGAYAVFGAMDKLNYRVSNNKGIGYDITATFDADRDDYLQKYFMGEVTADDLLDYWAGQWEKAYKDQGQLWK
ncbi:MAG: sugar ABC transporter substrate-binding protein [Eubacteriales bacterium]|nr:sugar ABC transporter substrate-binding protein [Eubacteriales bacterium]